jgi:gamma-glutamylcyclotransferase (GGCT)/AIG2-like uncharacterized protein YtfP
LDSRTTAQFYFAYGSNMNQERMQGRNMQVSSVTAGWIHGFGLRFNKRSRWHDNLACANIVFAPGERIEGALYELDNVAEIAKLDPHEGAPRRYSRDVFYVQTEAGRRPAWVYVANPAVLDNHIKPARWYVEHLLAGREFLSEDYWQAIKRTDCIANSVEWC